MKSSLTKTLLFALILVLVITSFRVLVIFKGQNTEIHKYKSLYETSQSELSQLKTDYTNLTKASETFAIETKSNIDRLTKDVSSLNHLLDIERQSHEAKKTKVIYLTFDDGPSSKITLQLLDLLDTYKVKATFFVTGYQVKQNPDVLKAIHDKGHAIGNHSASHDYYKIYTDFESFKDDFEKNQHLIKEVVGYEPALYRFPGGVVTAFNLAGKENKDLFEAYLWQNNVQYFDWNVDSRDASQVTPSVATIRNNILRQIDGKQNAIVLMHDTNNKQNTLVALKSVIEYCLEKGYRFEPLSEDGYTVQHKR